ncbi:hypothetical protein [Reinekea marinisedimentorum]|uniref:Concanavalin A-like lectin/glucanase superfamily protein n=1 Tax=Reinekea marinisedimentorum TaxID=230495 RepID=A0A4R3HV90_9GAMM|nr:hypothetical protein [Reinekea marinisedimentorum]TCS36121.1 hypothetical protein BCF53_1272 [Reinekea marinisedimentorum]
MKLRKATLLFLSTLLVLGCTDGDISVSDDDDDDDGDDGSTTGYSVLITDSGELNLDLITSIGTGEVSLEFFYTSNEAAEVLVGIYGQTDSTSSYRMAEVQLDSEWAVSGDLGVRLTDDDVYENSTLYGDIDDGQWVELTLSWDTTDGNYSLEIDNTDLGSFTLNTISSGGYENVGYIVIKVSEANTSKPVYIDNLEVYSGSSKTVNDDFDDYSVNTNLSANSGDYDYSESSNATISDDEDAG